MTEKKKLLFAFIGLLVAIGLMAGLYFIAKPKTQEGQKRITVTITDKDGATQSHEIATNAEYLSDALLENELVETTGTDSSMYVIAAGGIQADEANQEWWGLTIDGEMAMTGIADTPVSDGSVYAFTLNVGW